MTYVVDGLLVKEIGWYDLLDDLLQDLRPKLLDGDFLAVLRTDDNRVHAERNYSTTVVLVLNGDLSFRVWSEPWERAVAASSRHGAALRSQLCGSDDASKFFLT